MAQLVLNDYALYKFTHTLTHCSYEPESHTEHLYTKTPNKHKSGKNYRLFYDTTNSTHMNQQRQPPFYCHYTHQPAIAGASS